MPPSVRDIENAKGAPSYFKPTSAPSRGPEYRIIHGIDLVGVFPFVNVPNSWAYAPNSPRDILTWTDDYTYANYNLVGTVDLCSCKIRIPLVSGRGRNRSPLTGERARFQAQTRVVMALIF
jgi:hypothetical protein